MPKKKFDNSAPPDEVCAVMDWPELVLSKPGDANSCAIAEAIKKEYEFPDDLYDLSVEVGGATIHAVQPLLQTEARG